MILMGLVVLIFVVGTLQQVCAHHQPQRKETAPCPTSSTAEKEANFFSSIS
jgi:hypothetical protein